MHEPMTIHYLSPFRLPSDHAHSIQILNTCRALAELGHKVVLDVKRNRDQKVDSVTQGLAYYGLMPHPNLDIRFLPTLHNGIAGISARLRVRWARGERLVFYARHLRLARSAVKRGKAPVVLELHRFEEDMRPYAEIVHGITAIADPLRRKILDQFKLKTLSAVVPDAVDRTIFRKPSEHGSRRMVYTGHFYEGKGVDVLIRSLVHQPDMTALLIGGRDGFDLRRDLLQNMARELGVANRIEWTGRIPQWEIPGHIRIGDVGVVPTRSSNGQGLSASPLKLFEYLSMGLPVVATDMPSVHDVFDKVKGGALFEEGNPVELARVVQELVPEDAYAKAAAEADDSANNFTWERRAVMIGVFLEQVLTKSRV